MKITILAGGRKHSALTRELIAEYEKRMHKPFLYTWQFCDESELSTKVARFDKTTHVILLDEHGTELTSPDFAKTLQSPIEQGIDIVFVIGGAFGHFDDALKSRANLILSFSKMVFPHEICRILLAEQLYRAQEILCGGKYHHA